MVGAIEAVGVGGDIGVEVGAGVGVDGTETGDHWPQLLVENPLSVGAISTIGRTAPKALATTSSDVPPKPLSRFQEHCSPPGAA